MATTIEPELYDYRMQRKDCICCGVSDYPMELHHGQRWCYICVGRGHHEDGPHQRGEPEEW